jgi:hypothetical protein
LFHGTCLCVQDENGLAAPGINAGNGHAAAVRGQRATVVSVNWWKMVGAHPRELIG